MLRHGQRGGGGILTGVEVRRSRFASLRTRLDPVTTVLVDRSAVEADSTEPKLHAGDLHGPGTTTATCDGTPTSQVVPFGVNSRRKNEPRLARDAVAQVIPEVLLTLAPTPGIIPGIHRRLAMSEGNEVPEGGSRSKERSPNYPSVPLTQAVESAGRLYEREKRTTVAPDAAVRALGYNAMSGTARTMLASLKAYGLVESSQDGLRISELAMEIIHHPLGSPERTKALKEAAMRPPIIVELFGSHADASDDSLRAYLITRRKFSPDGAGRFIPAFREAVQIARLPSVGSSDDKRSGASAPSTPPAPAERVQPPRPAKASGDLMEFTWDLSGDVVATMTVSKRIELDDLDVLNASIEAAKLAIAKQARTNAARASRPSEPINEA